MATREERPCSVEYKMLGSLDIALDEIGFWHALRDERVDSRRCDVERTARVEAGEVETAVESFHRNGHLRTADFVGERERPRNHVGELRVLCHVAQNRKAVGHRLKGKDLSGESRQVKRIGPGVCTDVPADV